jgi:uncharacterized protein
MKINNLILGTFLLLIIAGNVNAASFDCKKATSEVEKIICNDGELSRLDDALNKVYLQALKRTDIKEQTIKSQKQWLKELRNACQDADSLKEAYETRIWELTPSPHDDYRWIEKPFEEDDEQYMQVDPKICKCYEENLRYFAKRNTPMSCNRPIAPHLENRIKEVGWEDLDPDQYPDLFRAITVDYRYLTDAGEDNIQRALKYALADVANKIRVFRRAKLSLVGRIQAQAYTADPEPYWIVQYGFNDVSPDNPDSFYRCIPTRGGGIDSRLRLYVVSETRHEFTMQLFSRRISAEGQNLRIIDDRLFVENIHPGARIELNEVNTAIAWGKTTCIFEFKQSK